MYSLRFYIRFKVFAVKNLKWVRSNRYTWRKIQIAKNIIFALHFLQERVFHRTGEFNFFFCLLHLTRASDEEQEWKNEKENLKPLAFNN